MEFRPADAPRYLPGPVLHGLLEVRSRFASPSSIDSASPLAACDFNRRDVFTSDGIASRLPNGSESVRENKSLAQQYFGGPKGMDEGRRRSTSCPKSRRCSYMSETAFKRRHRTHALVEVG
jgi:hypothetical protein